MAVGLHGRAKSPAPPCRPVARALRDRTIDGMNAGSDLWALMRDVTLPRELALPQVHGKVTWIVRSPNWRTMVLPLARNASFPASTSATPPAARASLNSRSESFS